MVPVGLLGGLGFMLLGSDWHWLGATVAAFAAALFVGLIVQCLRPRVALRGNRILFYLKAGGPIAVPLEVVEAFFQGEDLAHLPGESKHRAKSVNLIARLSQRATDWHERDVKPALGRWSEGYVTVRGTWCEPIDGEVIRRLNRRLNEVKQLDSSRAER